MVGVQAGHASGILLALAGGGWLVQAAIGWVVSLGPAFDSPAAAAARGREITEQVTAVGWSWMASLSAVTLLLVILVPAVLALVLALRERMGARKILDVGANRADPKLGFR